MIKVPTKKAEFKAPKMKPLLKLKPKFCLKKGRLLMILKESHLRRPRKKKT